MINLDTLMLEYRVENGRQAAAYERVSNIKKNMVQDIKILTAQQHLDTAKAPYLYALKAEEDTLKNVDENIAAIKNTIAMRWTLGTGEYTSDVGSIIIRTTKSLIVASKEKVVEVLRSNKKINDGIKTFQLTFLRKLKDVGVLPDEAAYYTHKQSVVITLKGK